MKITDFVERTLAEKKFAENSGIPDIIHFVRMNTSIQTFQPEVLRLLHSVELPIPDADDLFDCLDIDEGGSLSEEEFVNGCKRLRGTAKNRDLLQIQINVESINNISTELEEDLVDCVNELGDVAGMTRNILASVDRVEEALSACGTKAWVTARERGRLVDAARRQRRLVTQSPSRRNSLLAALEANKVEDAGNGNTLDRFGSK